MKNNNELRDFLEEKVSEYNHPSFIEKDPISVPHSFERKQDIEISGFFAAIFSWGNRRTIIQKSNELMRAMENEPYDFILNHQPADLKKLHVFRHRTFNSTDLLYFIRFLKSHYESNDSLESAFLPLTDPGKKTIQYISSEKGTGKNTIQHISSEKGTGKKTIQHISSENGTGIKTISHISSKIGNGIKKITEDSYCDGENEFIRNALSAFYSRFFSLRDAPGRTQKHIASPEKKSTCKRLNMYLRWMVRQDKKGVDFGIWRKINPSDLICPVDLHVARVARGFDLIRRRQTDWQTAMELTIALRLMDKKDPVKYDFALFGLGVAEKY
jgi:uncharacterized protein (TIGR02757 family)